MNADFMNFLFIKKSWNVYRKTLISTKFLTLMIIRNVYWAPN